MFYDCHREAMRAAFWEEVDEREWLRQYYRKTMVTAFFNGTGGTS
jgi:hypothetical protein